MNNIGRSIGKAMVRNGLSPGLRFLKDYSNRFNAIMIDKEQFSKTSICSSIVNEEFSLIDVGKGYNFGETFYCLGFYVDSGNCNGVVRLHGPEGIRDIYCMYQRESNENIMRFVPVKNGFNVKGVSVEWPFRSSEYALHSDFSFGPPFGVAFGKFLIYSPDCRRDLQNGRAGINEDDVWIK
jgi:hypothetical protein